MLFSTKQFRFDKPRNEMTADASTLRMNGYPETFLVTSHVTNKTLTVRRCFEVRTQDEDNELQAVHYRPTDPKHTFKVIIFND